MFQPSFCIFSLGNYLKLYNISFKIFRLDYNDHNISVLSPFRITSLEKIMVKNELSNPFTVSSSTLNFKKMFTFNFDSQSTTCNWTKSVGKPSTLDHNATLGTSIFVMFCIFLYIYNYQLNIILYSLHVDKISTTTFSKTSTKCQEALPTTFIKIFTTNENVPCLF